MDFPQSPFNEEILSETSGFTAAKRIVAQESFAQKRYSPRLKDIPETKRPYYGTSGKLARQQVENPGDDNAVANQPRKGSYEDVNGESLIDIDIKYDHDYAKMKDLQNMNGKKHAGRGSTSDSGTTSVDTSSTANEGGDCRNSDLEASNNKWLESSSSSSAEGKSALEVVKETVQTYDRFYLQLVQEEEDMHKKVEGDLQKAKRLQRKVYLAKEQSFTVPSELPGLVCMDIAAGQEGISIPAFNLIDDTPFAPTGFTYSRSIKVAENVDRPPNADGCKCKGICINPKTCACALLNGSKFPYVRYNGGRLTRAKDVVFECGPNCGCGPDCINRISQRGIKYHLEVFRTQDKGWAVRTRDFIPSGAPVCEYVGVLKRTDELDNVDDNDYIFEIDCLHTIKGIEGRERRLEAVSPICNKLEKIDDRYLERNPEFCIDANSFGNVARFINHSCEPNLFVQCILSAHHDVRLAQVVLFASKRIRPLEELTYDYGYPLDSVVGSDGKVKWQPCHCGTAECRKRLY